jgi:hypothetical protein
MDAQSGFRAYSKKCVIKTKLIRGWYGSLTEILKGQTEKSTNKGGANLN